MSSTSFAESISQSITGILTKIMDVLQNFLWNAAELNAKLWLWMPEWLEITLIVISLITLFFLVRYAWKNREFWTDIIQGKY